MAESSSSCSLSSSSGQAHDRLGQIASVAHLDNKIFVIRSRASIIEVFEADRFHSTGKIVIGGSRDNILDCIVSSASQHCLYVSDIKQRCIWRVNPDSGDVRRWFDIEQECDSWMIAVNQSSIHLTLFRNTNSYVFQILDPDGQVTRKRHIKWSRASGGEGSSRASGEIVPPDNQSNSDQQPSLSQPLIMSPRNVNGTRSLRDERNILIRRILSIIQATQCSNSYITKCVNELKNLQEQDVTETVVAVYGKMGAGKSSLLNAILGKDGVDFLPTSESRACTACPVKISSNADGNWYQADVEFLTKEEYRQRVSEEDPDEETNGETYNNTIQANYQPIKCHTADEFMEAVRNYMSADGDGESLWEFVKCMHVKIPDSEVCATGVTMVDLPGPGDANITRGRAAQNYLENCNAVWAVSDIRRAISDDIVDIIKSQFFRELLMEGCYGSFSFICTKSDQINFRNYIRSENIRQNDTVMDLQDQINIIDEDIRSIRNTGSESDLARLKEKKATVQIKLAEVCARRRNDECKRLLDRTVKEIISENINGREKNEAPAYTGSSSSCNQLRIDNDETCKVFCVSSKEFCDFQQNNSDQCQTFTAVEHTGIPELLRYARGIAERRAMQLRIKTARSIGEQTLNVIHSLSRPLIQDPQKRENAREIFHQCLTRLTKKFDRKISAKMTELRGHHNNLVRDIDSGVRQSKETVEAVVAGWATKCRCVQTYRAAVRRLGEYRSRTAGEINFNLDLLKAFDDTVMKSWIELFRPTLSDIENELLTNTETCYRRIGDCLREGGIELESSHLPAFNDFPIRSGISSALEFMRNSHRQAARLRKQTICNHMHDIYLEMADVRKQQVMETQFKERLRTTKEQLYNNLADRIKRALDDFLTELENKLRSISQGQLEDLSNNYAYIFDDPNMNNTAERTNGVRQLIGIYPILTEFYHKSDIRDVSICSELQQMSQKWSILARRSSSGGNAAARQSHGSNANRQEESAALSTSSSSPPSSPTLFKPNVAHNQPKRSSQENNLHSSKRPRSSND